MGLFVDIEGNDKFAKQALATATALDKIAESEKLVNALASKLGVTSKQVGQAQKHIADQNRANEHKVKQEQLARAKRESSFKETIMAGAAAWYLFKDGVSIATDSVFGLGKGLLQAAFSASQTKREAKAMIGAYTNDRAPQFMKALDGLAAKLGQTTDDTRSQFVKFREAGVSQQMSFRLIKARADMLALGLSAQTADHYIGDVASAGRDIGVGMARLRIIEKHIKGVGGGATAAAYAMTSLSAAQAKVESAVNDRLAELWDRVAPAIGKAAHNVADFVTEFLKSEKGKAVIDGIVNAVTGLASVVSKANIADAFTKAAEAIVDVATALAKSDIQGTMRDIVDVARTMSKVMRGLDIFGDEDKFKAYVKAGDKAIDAIDTNSLALSEKRAELAGRGIGQGLADGMRSNLVEVDQAGADVGAAAEQGTKDKLQLHSPSKVFERQGKMVVAGFNRGQESALASTPAPIEREQTAVARERPAAPQLRQVPGTSTSTTDRSTSITIQRLIVQGGQDAEETARTIRQELQLLLTAGNLSRGVTSV